MNETTFAEQCQIVRSKARCNVCANQASHVARFSVNDGEHDYDICPLCLTRALSILVQPTYVVVGDPSA